MCVPSASRARAPRALDPRGDAGTRRSALHRAFSTPFPAHHPRTRRRPRTARASTRITRRASIVRSFDRRAHSFGRSFDRSIESNRSESTRLDSTRRATRDARGPLSLARARSFAFGRVRASRAIVDETPGRRPDDDDRPILCPRAPSDSMHSFARTSPPVRRVSPCTRDPRARTR